MGRTEGRNEQREEDCGRAWLAGGSVFPLLFLFYLDLDVLVSFSFYKAISPILPSRSKLLFSSILLLNTNRSEVLI